MWWKSVSKTTCPPRNTQSQQTPTKQLDGPLFGGHHKGDFSLRRSKNPNLNKALPPIPPEPKSVRFGASPPAWEFYRHTPPEDNTANTRYLPHSSPLLSPQNRFAQLSPYPLSTEKHLGLKVWNK